jgi:hypothetical protein
MNKLLVATAIFVATAALPGCSSDADGDRALPRPHAAGSAGAANVIVDVNGDGSSTPGPGDGSGAGLGECGAASFDGCVGNDFEGESVPLDIYVMFDTSGSMLNDVGGMTRLKAVQDAATAFLRDPASRGIGVGIGYFGTQPIGSTSCEPSAYAQPDVAVSTDHEAVIASLAARMPTGETPTGAALRAACSYARDEKAAHPERALVILLMTDGKPEAPVSCAAGTCCPTLDDAVQATADCAAGSRGIATYVLGVGPELDNLNQIAAAGKTHSAYLVGDQNVTANVLSALNAIRGDAAIPCELSIPRPSDGSALDYSRVNLVYSTSGCDFQAAYYVDSAASCDTAGGWYYDDPNAPRAVELCPATCDDVSIPGASLRFSVGCATLPKPVR